jgi:hypothetical protein
LADPSLENDPDKEVFVVVVVAEKEVAQGTSKMAGTCLISQIHVQPLTFY